MSAICPCGIVRTVCDYHRPEPQPVTTSRPHCGDYVGRDLSGTYLYICAVDYSKRLVKIATYGGSGPWLNETEARAQYNYTWGGHPEPRKGYPSTLTLGSEVFYYTGSNHGTEEYKSYDGNVAWIGRMNK